MSKCGTSCSACVCWLWLMCEDGAPAVCGCKVKPTNLEEFNDRFESEIIDRMKTETAGE